MDYKIQMPILSDTMDKGTLVKWYVKDGDKVKKDEKIADVESDKAIIDIHSYHDGYIKLLVKEGDEVAVKSDIAVIQDKKPDKAGNKVESKETDIKEKQQVKKVEPKKENQVVENSFVSLKKQNKGSASPLARAFANEHELDIERLQKENKLPTPAHQDDVKALLVKKYFTPKAQKIALEYDLFDKFNFSHKITTHEVEEYIKQNHIPKIKKLSNNQKAVVKTLQNSLNKPTFHIFEEIVINSVKKDIKLTAVILKALAVAMQKNPLSRSILRDDNLLTYQSSNISVALSRDDSLYMMVIKEAEEMSLEEINRWLKDIKSKKISLEDLSGSTFGLSNLGMFDIDSFDALINDKDSGIVAVGRLNESKIKVVFTFDHRIFNGVSAARFVNDFKEKVLNEI